VTKFAGVISWKQSSLRTAGMAFTMDLEPPRRWKIGWIDDLDTVWLSTLLSLVYPLPLPKGAQHPVTVREPEY